MGFVIKLENKYLSFFVSVLIFISLSPAIFGGIFTKVSLIILIVFNTFMFCNIKRLKYIFFIMIVFLILILKSIINDDNVDSSIYILLLNILFFVTLYKSHNVYLNAYLRGILISVILGFVMSVISIYYGLNQYSVSLANKGFLNIHSITGFTKIPQTFGSLCILLMFIFMTKKNKIFSNLFLIISMLTINRVSLFTGLLLKSTSFNKLYYIVILIVIFPLLWLLPDLTIINNSQTIFSRFDMILNIIQHMLNQNIFDLLFGSFQLPDFSIYKGTDITYIENGFMFIFYYFGIVGVLSYLLFSFYILCNVRKKGKIYVYYSFLVLIVIPNFTHEYLFLSFYLSLIFILSNKNNTYQ
ncbi:hypothetical protein [Photobacterium piscicola]|uniref:hypothetical protein n=1 Tax=Photobacterium piscicola TaxID=1378299 RepID=UPI003735FDEF